MWRVLESKDARKVSPTLPAQVASKYEVWKSIVATSGPSGLRAIKGFHDEALKGQLKGRRSSRLGDHFRVIYEVEHDEVLILVIEITPHVYRR